MPRVLSEEMQHHIVASMREDIGDGDITTEAIFPEEDIYKARIFAKDSGVLAGIHIAEAVFGVMDQGLDFSITEQDGAKVTPGQTVATLEGKAKAIITGERVALNYIQHLSGIASLTRQFVEAIKHTHARILDTRKTLPGLRAFEKYAVRTGGGENHRMGLYDEIMIKDNHIAAAGSVKEAIERCLILELPIQVECDTLEQVKQALKAGADSLLLDNMSTETLTAAVHLIDNQVACEASGGVNLQTVKAIAETGVDYISVGRLTQSAPALDFSLEIV